MSLNKSKVLRSAEKYVLQGKLPAAIDEYRKVVDADPADLTTINTLGDLYVRAGRIQDAITNFSRIADSYREGGFTLKAIAMRSPKTAPTAKPHTRIPSSEPRRLGHRTLGSQQVSQALAHLTQPGAGAVFALAQGLRQFLTKGEEGIWRRRGKLLFAQANPGNISSAIDL